jgi:hypothetical protein
MQSENEENPELASIVEQFYSSVQGKFERSGCSDWDQEQMQNSTNNDTKEPSKRKLASRHDLVMRLLRSRPKFFKKLSKRVVGIKKKVQMAKKPRSFPKTNAASFQMDDQITKGSNTPVNSRPSSISISVDHIDGFRQKVMEGNSTTDISHRFAV